MKLSYYLHFNGTCLQALQFYKNCLGGEIKGLQTFGQSPMPAAGETKDKIMHAEFHLPNGEVIMASDSMPDQQVVQGTNFAMSLNFTDVAEQKLAFERISSGGTISMPLQDTFWGARFGMCTDPFGIRWMFNCTLPQHNSTIAS